MQAQEVNAVIQYSLRPSPGKLAGLVVPRTAAEVPKNGFPLRLDTFRAQHGNVPLRLQQQFADGTDEEQIKELFSEGNRLIPVSVTIKNARVLNKAPTLRSHGFQLLRGLPSSAISCASDAAAAAKSAQDSSVAAGYYREIEAALMKATGATRAVAFCHARRSTSTDVRKSAAGAGFAAYAHTDNSAESWSARMKELLTGNSWESVGPPGVSEEVARQAVNAGRYAVVAAWRYLGPEARCRSSHLAVLDHYSMRAEDVIDFTLVAGDTAGGNYRLAAPPSLGDSPGQHPYHSWYYYPEMTKDEMLVFTVFDSDRKTASPSFKTMPVPSCFHSAFMDPSPASQEVPSRESIDVRCLLIWDSELENINTANKQVDAVDSSLEKHPQYQAMPPSRKISSYRSTPYGLCRGNHAAECLQEVMVA